MYQETENKIIFFFVDFGSSHEIGSSHKMIETFTPNFSPPEQDKRHKNYDLKKQSKASDIYSLSKSFSNIQRSCKIEISEPIKQVLEEMCCEEIEKRLSAEICIQKISQISRDLMVENNLNKNKNDNLVIEQNKKDEKKFKFCQNLDQYRSEMKNFCEMNNYSPIPDFEEIKGEESTQNDTFKELDRKQLIEMILQVTNEKEEKIKEKEEIIKLKDQKIEELIKEIEELRRNEKN